MDGKERLTGTIFYLLNIAIGYMTIIWAWTNEPHLAIVTGSLGIVVAVLTFLKPDLADAMPFRRGMASKSYREQSARLFSIIIFVVSIFILRNFEVTKAMHLGVLLLLFGGGVLVNSLVWLGRVNRKGSAERERPGNPAILFFSLLSLLFIAPGIYFIGLDRRINLSDYNIYTFMVAATVGFLFGHLALWLLGRRAKREDTP